MAPARVEIAMKKLQEESAAKRCSGEYDAMPISERFRTIKKARRQCLDDIPDKNEEELNAISDILGDEEETDALKALLESADKMEAEAKAGLEKMRVAGEVLKKAREDFCTMSKELHDEKLIVQSRRDAFKTADGRTCQSDDDLLAEVERDLTKLEEIAKRSDKQFGFTHPATFSAKLAEDRQACGVAIGLRVPELQREAIAEAKAALAQKEKDKEAAESRET